MIVALALALVGSPLRLETKWAADAQLPFPRVHGIVRSGEDYIVGGLQGLAKGKPGHWKQVDERPIREMVSNGDQVWVLFGDGSVDKLEPKTGKLFYDVMSEAKRPWVSSLGFDGKRMLLGGQGGWTERDDAEMRQSYPPELKDQIVTSVCRNNGGVWLGTQRNGLFRSGAKFERFGFAAGLPDSWVTALTTLAGKLIVGVADGGLVRFDGKKLAPLSCPCAKVRKLIAFRNRLVVGGMDGTWIETGEGWTQLGTEETTALTVIDDKLAVGTPTGIAWWK